MHKRYFRKNDSQHVVDGTEWIEMSGKEYYQFVTAPQNMNRYFIDMGDVVLECTKAEYKKFKSEDDHSGYILEQEAGWITQSLEYLAVESGLCSDELVADMSHDVENEAIARLDAEALYFALSHLDFKSYRLIYALYLDNECMTERELARQFTVTQNAIHKQKKRILKTLKFWVVKFQKSSQ